MGVMEILNNLYYCEVFYKFFFHENMKVYFTVGSRRRGFVVLRNDWVFIVMGV